MTTCRDTGSKDFIAAGGSGVESIWRDYPAITVGFIDSLVKDGRDLLVPSILEFTLMDP